MSSKPRALTIAALAIAIASVLVIWRCRGGAPPAPPEDAASSSVTKLRLRLRDLARQPAGSIHGAVIVEGAPSAQATVCAKFADDDREDEPRCVAASGGRYALLDLRPGGYLVWASVPGYAGVRWRDRDGSDRLALAAGTQREGIDLALAARGAEISGRVRDTRGAAIAGALVHVRTEHERVPAFSTTTKPDGTFVAYAASGSATVEATAADHVDASVETTVPATGIELALLPGATLSGLVIEAGTRAPVADARVSVDGSHVTTGDDGRFRVTALKPGRYKPTASAIGGYGEAVETVLLRLGATAEDIVIEVHPVTVVAGRIVIAGTSRGCPEGDGNVVLARRGSRDWSFGRTIGDDGEVLLEGLVPGAYAVRVACVGYLAEGSYPDLVVGDSDLEGLAWSVKAGARVSGRVTAKDGRPIAEASVYVNAGLGQGARVSTAADGSFVAAGLTPGEVTITAARPGYLSSAEAKVQATLAGTTGVEVVLDTAGGIEGVVVDRGGRPVAGVRVEARQRVAGEPEPTAGPSSQGPASPDRAAPRSGAQVNSTSGLRGEFAFIGLEPGGYDVVAESRWQLPGGSRLLGKPVRAVVARDGTARVRLEVETEVGTLAGIVVDARGAPLADVAIDVALTTPELEPRRRDWELGLAWTSATGEFSIAGIPDHAIAVRARIAGANEVVVDGVSPRERVRLVMKPTGSISGIVVDQVGGRVDDVTLEIEDRAQDISRQERLFFTGGKFSFKELPAGHYRITADEDRQTSVTIDLAEGAQRAGVQLQLRPRHAIRGRLVSPDRRPLANWRLEALHKESIEKSANGRIIITYDNDQAITDARGEFLIEGLIGAEVSISAGDLAGGGDPTMIEVATLPLVGPPVIDVGELVVPAP